MPACAARNGILVARDFCPLCGGRSACLWRGERPTHHCGGCGIVRADPPAGAVPQAFWSRGYYERHYLPRADALIADFSAHLERVEQQAAPGDWLDVGCGAGYFAAAALARGWRVTGIDPSPEALRFAAEVAPGAELRCGHAASLPRRGLYDVVSFWDSLAYVPDVRSTLTACLEHLKPGGLLLVKTPNLPPRLFYLLQALLWWRPALRDEFARSQSRWYFTGPSLERLLGRLGFERPSSRWADEVSVPDQPGALSWPALARAGVERALSLAAGPHSSCLVTARAPRG